MAGKKTGLREAAVAFVVQPRFFLKLAAESVREVHRMTESSGISYIRKAMMKTGLSLDGNRCTLWSEAKLTHK